MKMEAPAFYRFFLLGVKLIILWLFLGHKKPDFMNKISICLFGTAFLLCLSFPVFSQQTNPPFWNEIRQFEHEDSIQKPPAHAILFVGSSSFRKWTDMRQAFPGYRIINRGFGGATLPDVIRYADQIIFPYHPEQIVIYCGDNDAASGDHITADSIRNRFEQLYDLIRGRLPKVKITFVSIKPSPSRMHLMPVMDYANWLIRNFLKTQAHASFVDVYHQMLDDHGLPRNALFTGDMLHMKSNGYAIWQKAIQPELVKKRK